MMMIRFFTILFTILGVSVYAQTNILQDIELQNEIEQCLSATYNFDFPEANHHLRIINKKIPSHPASSFLNAIIIYWENFPILPEDKAVDLFEKAMQKTIRLSQSILEKDPENLQGIFFDMHARAYLAMFWADNGKPGKVLRDIDNMYRYTLKGIDRKEEFEEFYFSSGLYKYYIESYANSRPIYKPALALFRKGSTSEGLQELSYASTNAIFLKTEALFFLSLLELNYENNLHKASQHTQSLYRSFPKNIYFINQHLITLCYSEKFEEAKTIAKNIQYNSNSYYQLIYHTTEGLIEELQNKNHSSAKHHYQKAILLSERYGDRANIQLAISFAGLARIKEKEKKPSEAKRLNRKSRAAASYPFITSL